MGEVRQRGKIWWIRYCRNGKRHEESSKSSKKQTALDLLKVREGDIAKGVPVTAKMNRFRFDEAAKDLITEYRVNDRRSAKLLRRRINNHLIPFFGSRRMAEITTADIREYVAHRKAATEIVKSAYTRLRRDGTVITVAEQRRAVDGVSNATINRELTILKRMFSLAVQADKLLRRPHIPLLEERNTRTGFFEVEQLAAVLRHLPVEIRSIVRFAYITGWRIPSEVLPLEWRQIDFAAGEIRLDPETTKNRDGRIFPMTDDLRALLKAQHDDHVALKQTGVIEPWVFFRMIANGRGGTKAPQPIKAFTVAWKNACRLAGCPGRIPHDLRRTAVRNMVRRGVPERVAMQLAGHKTRSVFDRYNIVSDGDLRRAAQQLSGLTGTVLGQPGTPSPVVEGETRKKSRKVGGAVRI